MRKLLTTDSFLLGVVYGLLLPALFYGGIFLLKDEGFDMQLFNNARAPYFLSLIPNLVLLRFLFITFKVDKTGRGLLAITFAEFIAVFIFI